MPAPPPERGTLQRRSVMAPRARATRGVSDAPAKRATRTSRAMSRLGEAGPAARERAKPTSRPASTQAARAMVRRFMGRAIRVDGDAEDDFADADEIDLGSDEDDLAEGAVG
jgi:hypothetical protein